MLGQLIETKPCFKCGKREYLAVTGPEAERLAAGELVHVVLAHWTPAQRELMISGIHPECWKQMFGTSA